MTSSAVISGISVFRRHPEKEVYGSTSTKRFQHAGLICAEQMVLGGWDFRGPDLHEGPLRHGFANPNEALAVDHHPLFAGLTTSFDYPPDEDCNYARRPNSLEEGAVLVANDILEFKAACGVQSVTVMYLGNPPEGDDAYWSDRAIGGDALFPAGFMYALGAIKAGANFADFTPSPTLANRDLWDMASRSSTVLSGRDGSTGQTMLKQTLVELYQRRNLQIAAWYSTNIIGNRDGRVVADPKYNKSKIADKTDSLNVDNKPEHHVSIDFVEHWGDRKEAWDAIEIDGWLESRLSVRVNARGEDSFLAAPMVLDIFRLIVKLGSVGRYGFVPELGYFYKRPFDREHLSISERWNELVGLFK